MGKFARYWLAGVSMVGSLVTMGVRLAGCGPGKPWVWDLVAYVTLILAFLLVLRDQRRERRLEVEKQRAETAKYRDIAISEYVQHIDDWYKRKTHNVRPFGTDEEIMR